MDDSQIFLVTVSGVVVNMVVLIALTEGLDSPYYISSLFAIELSILSSFALNNCWTRSDRRTTSLAGAGANEFENGFNVLSNSS